MAITKIITELTDLNAASSTSGLKMPSGGAFSGTATEGMMRNDTSQSSESSDSTMQFYNGTDWKNFVNVPGLVATANFSPVLYTGNGSSQVVTGLDFQPDLVWIKSRSQANKHVLTNVIRGTDRQLFTDSTDQESVNSNRITSFNSNGFTIGSGDSRINSNGVTYVAWCWKAGGSPVTNNDGTLQSQVSANVDAGFSISTYTSTGTNGSTVGHGLNSAPNLVIIKSTTNITNWIVYNSESGTSKYMYVNSSSGEQTGAWFGTSSDTFTLNNTFSDANTNGRGYIAYCFHDIPGYQKIGSYTGNGSTSGPTVTTDFEPAFLLIKRTDGANSWAILDNKRSSTNPRNKELYANLTDVESTFTAANFLTNGFQLINTANGYNANGGNYIYLAIA